MKKLIITLVTILIVIILIVLVLRERLSKEGILGAIEKQTGLIIELLDEGTWDFYPTITYINSNASITYKDSLLTIQNANIQINKNYPKARKNIGLVYLLLSNFHKGFEEFEWRIKDFGLWHYHNSMRMGSKI